MYLDFCKAFDSVSHEKLLYKLHAYGIKGHLLLWIKAYLSFRAQCVRIDGCLSSYVNVTSGAPQGSVLGPLLFLFYINDIPEFIKFVEISIFADDVKFLASHSAKNARGAIPNLQEA